ncbi:GNAT family N-acetyltransferase [Staphylococcus cohnii]|uniref:GNAT family N-acetyltransferase n=1 Tax=Staphylococcus cohnii TaxID=29382 RepID=A0A2T4LPD1_9STAP|nr:MULTISPECIES: GNAT family N-acetyltransferase [Staphylococcus]MBA1353913.1 GNAT family N-acetyltransferase [Staphylococcus cohnii]MBA1390286.1 GNAT family N-acetyltransferase [Staphylococcus cohnii]MBB2507264.1 putative N-acetyltransferase YtmI [Staphylococcus cohnii subsp. barensis]MBZ8173566.1 GNAT family N-acetyltransferase [Staphylococcus cohnii]MCE5032893.1 GNAT family N-acetyltransferase [Staphylococcus cohnii]
MSDYNIRIAEIDDAEALQKLMYEAFTPLRELGIDWPSVNASVEMVEKNLQTGTTFVLENNAEIISTITVRYPWETQRRISIYPFVWWFATKPSYDGQGLGGKLLKYVEETYLRDTLKVPAVTLGTSARKHPWLLDIYKRRGYEVYAEHESNDGDLGVIMRKVLIPERFDEEVLGQPPF